MTEYFRFLYPEYNPPGLSGAVGGGITSGELPSSLNSLLVPAQVSGSSYYQYRKLWIEQLSEDSFTSLGLQFANSEYSNRVEFAYATGAYATGVATNPLTIPENIVDGDFSSSIDGSLDLSSGEAGSQYAIWIRQAIVSGDQPDSMASVNIRITGAQ